MKDMIVRDGEWKKHPRMKKMKTTTKNNPPCEKSLECGKGQGTAD